jgi:tether containing UBX domain for GLUT4
MDKFPSNTSLWMILRKLETSATANLNFTGRGAAQTTSGSSGAGRIYYEEPVLNIMGRELSSFGDLQKTLAQLGLNSGSSLIRLSFRRTEQPLEEAMMQIGQYFKAVEEPTAPGAHASGPANSETVPAADDMEGVLSPDPALATPDNVAESSGSSEAAPPP